VRSRFRQRDEYVFAEEFFAALLEALALPMVFVGAEYGEVQEVYNNDPEARKALLHAGDGML
jgi:hypothetical protein